MLALGDKVKHLDNTGELGLRIFRHQGQHDVAVLGLPTHKLVLEWEQGATVLEICNAGGVASMGM